jgi:hypothetical protein
VNFLPYLDAVRAAVARSAPHSRNLNIGRPPQLTGEQEVDLYWTVSSRERSDDREEICLRWARANNLKHEKRHVDALVRRFESIQSRALNFTAASRLLMGSEWILRRK